MRGVPWGVSINMLLGLKVEGGPREEARCSWSRCTMLCPWVGGRWKPLSQPTGPRACGCSNGTGRALAGTPAQSCRAIWCLRKDLSALASNKASPLHTPHLLPHHHHWTKSCFTSRFLVADSGTEYLSCFGLCGGRRERKMEKGSHISAPSLFRELWKGPQGWRQSGFQEPREHCVPIEQEEGPRTLPSQRTCEAREVDRLSGCSEWQHVNVPGLCLSFSRSHSERH